MDVIYGRQSLDVKDSISIEVQIEHCLRELAKDQRYEVYSDKGYSGSNLNRPAFQRLLEDVKAGKIDRIITYRLDRISRSVLDFANLIALFEQYGVTFVSTQEKFDTSTPMGKAMLNITMVFAQLERETIQQRVKDNFYARGEKGMYLGGPAPLGFKKIDAQTAQGKLKMLQEDTERSPIVVKMFHMYGNEKSTLGDIARYLNEADILSSNGRTWDTSKISRTIRNPAYVKASADVYAYYRNRGCKFTNDISDFASEKGCYLYGKRDSNERKYTDVTDHVLSLAPHDGLIPSDLFLKCQDRLDKNKQIDNSRWSKKTWLTGLTKCKQCGLSVIPKSCCNNKYTYMYCTGKQILHACNIEGNLGSLESVEKAVEEQIFAWSEKYSDLRASIEITNGKERNRIQCRMLEIAESIDKLIDLAISSSGVTVDYLNKKIAELETERKALENEQNSFSDTAQENLSREVADIKNVWHTLELAQKNSIATFIINRINLSHGEIEIEWKYDFNL